jgi:flagellar biosynthetic protein FliR
MLERLVSAEVFAAFLVFARIGAAFAILPGIGEVFVAMRARLLLAIAVSFVLAPAVADTLPGLPASPITLIIIVCQEIGIGLFLGVIARTLLAALQTAGMIVGMQTGLSSALVFDPNFNSQSAAPAVMMTMIGLVLIFATNSHHVMLSALADSYISLPAGHLPPLDDMVTAIVRVTGDSFSLGVRIAAPFLVFGVVFFLGLGLLARLMPQIQVFFLAVPLQIVLGLGVMVVTLALGMAVFLDSFRNGLLAFGR